jgi:L-cysteine desulfidase
MSDIQDLLVDIVREDSKPALGCTEPAAVAFAGAFAKKYITGKIENIRVITSKNIFKNGKSVIIPRAGGKGLDLAAALGVTGGYADDGLMVLKHINKQDIQSAKDMVTSGMVTATYIEASPSIYVNIVLRTDKETVELELRDGHTYVEWVKVNGNVVYHIPFKKSQGTSYEFLKDLSIKELRQICEAIPIEKIQFVTDGIDMNKNASLAGLKSESGLNIGSALMKLNSQGKLNMDVFTKARVLTAAACDMRMGGGEYPIMTSGGSGNQGIGVILPIKVVAEYENIGKEKLIRAVFFAHIINRYVKIYTGKLSSICGCAIAAGVGAAAAITWMLGGDDEKIEGSCQNILANLMGMICDGAKDTCSFKLSTSAEEAVLDAYLAMEGVIAEKNVGVVGSSIEDTIKNMGFLCKRGLDHTDAAILEIIN